MLGDGPSDTLVGVEWVDIVMMLMSLCVCLVQGFRSGMQSMCLLRGSSRCEWQR